MAARDIDDIEDFDELPDAERHELIEEVFGEPMPDDPSDASTDDDAAREPPTPDADAEEALKVLEATVDQLADGEMRAEQRRMCELVAKALANGEHLAVQAGTGVGKSFAYGVPAALHDKRVVIATATKALQDQLKMTDMPMVAQAVRSRTNSEPVVAVLKGRSNYICREKMPALKKDAAKQKLLDDEEAKVERQHLVEVIDFAERTTTGDIADMESQPPPAVWKRASATRAECPGKDICLFGETCFTELARERAAEADVVVVNHALYASYLEIKGAVLPVHEAVIIDEAHQFADFVTSAAGLAIGKEYFDDIMTQARVLVDDQLIDEVRGVAEMLDQALEARDGEPEVGRRELVEGKTPLASALLLADGRLETLSREVSAELKARGESTEHQMLIGLIADLLGDLRTVQEEAGVNSKQSLAFYVDGPEGKREFRGAPLSVGDYVQRQLDDDDSTTVVLTSATLDSDLPHELGFGRDCHYEDVGSPFDYQANALLYVPKHLPAPNQRGYQKEAQMEIEALIGAIGGRTLALFTSWRALNENYEALAKKKGDLGINLYRQGDDRPNAALIELLRTDPTTVIFATMTFWQGVDVPGDGLQLLIVDKLPFPVPSDPLFAARAKHLENDGGRNSFNEMSIPHTSRMLAQGLGRLIRTSTDRGVAAVLDSRLANKGYRTRLLKPVPPMRRTVELTDALTFLHTLRGA